MTVSKALAARPVAKVWGRDRLPSPFDGYNGERIGEIWFEPPPELPELLVKYIFTSESLSVQVHPADADAPKGNRGKDECWLILAADPGARLAVGFRELVSEDTMRAAALDGTIGDLLNWHVVEAGDFFYLPAGTVHAIGAGISLIEIQQNSDITYRLYDYGRPRQLHLDEGIAVANGDVHDAACHSRVPRQGSRHLVDGPRFRLDLIEGPPKEATLRHFARRPVLLAPLDGQVTIASLQIEPGGCGLVADLSEVACGKTARYLVAQPV